MQRRWTMAQFEQSIDRCGTTLRIALFSCLAMSPCFGWGEEPPVTIVRIEEDWEMKLLEPDPENNSPQITFFTRPSEDDPSRYFQTQMNYAADEEFSGGGFHVAAVLGDAYFDEARSSTRQRLASSNDTVVWTTVMAKQSDEIVFAIKNGHCVDWGDFGGVDFLVRLPAESIENLNNYHPEQSLESIDVGFGGNRVDYIMLKSIRVYYSHGVTKTFPINQIYEQ
jgi:hypothetical protein